MGDSPQKWKKECFNKRLGKIRACLCFFVVHLSILLKLQQIEMIWAITGSFFPICIYTHPKGLLKDWRIIRRHWKAVVWNLELKRYIFSLFSSSHIPIPAVNMRWVKEQWTKKKKYPGKNVNFYNQYPTREILVNFSILLGHDYTVYIHTKGFQR